MSTALLTILICNVGGPGGAKQGQPVVDQFVRRLEHTGKWKPNTLRGVYRTQRKDCERYYRASKPALVVLDLPTYLNKRRSWRLRPLAHVGGAASKRYYLLVQKGRFKQLDKLAGKQLVTPLAKDPAFLYRVVLSGPMKSRRFELVHSGRPLKGLRQVARGQADATLVDEAAYAFLQELELASELEPIYRSKALPGLTLALSEHGRSIPRLNQQVAAALPALCEGAGTEICKTFGVAAFVRAKPAVYRRLERQYRQ